MFNSKNRTNVDLGFRLGGYDEKSEGVAWFSDFKIEEGNLDNDTKWNMACFLIENIDININKQNKLENVKLKMTSEDEKNIRKTIDRLCSSIKTLSNSNMSMTCDIINIEKPLTTISYDEKNEYYIDPADVKSLIKKYIEKEEYDHIFIVARLGNLNENTNILVHDWIGLGGMDYYGIGFSNIRLPDNQNSYLYKYNPKINTFPEEVFVHEFLHTLERNEKEYGNNNIANLHDYEKYGYKNEPLKGLKNWYLAYMQNSIKNSDKENLGLTKDIYYLSKPIHESNFKHSSELNKLKQPQNLIEEIISLKERVKKFLSRK